MILSESAARLAWPNKDAVGQQMKIAGTWTTVVGVAADTRYRELTVLRPPAHRPRAQFEAAPPFLAIRTVRDPIALAPAIRSVGQEAWPVRRLRPYGGSIAIREYVRSVDRLTESAYALAHRPTVRRSKSDYGASALSCSGRSPGALA